MAYVADIGGNDGLLKLYVVAVFYLEIVFNVENRPYRNDWVMFTLST